MTDYGKCMLCGNDVNSPEHAFCSDCYASQPTRRGIDQLNLSYVYVSMGTAAELKKRGVKFNNAELVPPKGSVIQSFNGEEFSIYSPNGFICTIQPLRENISGQWYEEEIII